MLCLYEFSGCRRGHMALSTYKITKLKRNISQMRSKNPKMTKIARFVKTKSPFLVFSKPVKDGYARAYP